MRIWNLTASFKKTGVIQQSASDLSLCIYSIFLTMSSLTFLGLLALVPFVFSVSLPSIAIPTAIPPTTTGGTPLDSASSLVSNAVCESNPTHLLCGTSVATGHKIIQNFPANTTLRPCDIFLASPHCCAQFCLPEAGGSCDSTTGACFCNSACVPRVCQLLMRSDSSSTAEMNSNDFDMLDICREKCKSNPNGCTKAAAATDGIVGTVCFCYCDPASK